MAINESSSSQQVEEARRKGFWSRFRRNSKRNDQDEEMYKWPSKAGMVPHAKPPNNEPYRRVVIEQAPPAREAAFSGPPRYDWMDIETAAAIQVQAAYRRNRVMNQLEAQGYSTAAIRRRAIRREAPVLPDFLACCGVGFVFDYEERQEQHASQKQARAEREARMREQYLRKQREREYENPLLEAFEVVE